jgi:hypothetical protein
MIKPETVTIVIYPSGADADSLTVADAMQQVLDVFALLSKAEAQRVGTEHVVWRLERASTNTPLTVSAFAVSSDPEGSVDHEAHLAKTALGEGWIGILSGQGKAAWIDGDAEVLVKRILDRNLNGIGRTDIRLDDDLPPVIIDHGAAFRAKTFLERQAAEAAAQVEDLTRTEHGSIEGRVVGITTHYKRPAFIVRSRLTGRDVKCVLTEAAAEKVGAQHNWQEAWNGQRVLVPGRLYYNAGGDLIKVDADDVQIFEAKNLSAKEFQDPTFSEGLTPKAHLRRLWGSRDDNK